MAAKSKIDPSVQEVLTRILDLLYDVTSKIGDMKVGREQMVFLSTQLNHLDDIRVIIESLSLS